MNSQLNISIRIAFTKNIYSKILFATIFDIDQTNMILYLKIQHNFKSSKTFLKREYSLSFQKINRTVLVVWFAFGSVCSKAQTEKEPIYSNASELIK